MTKRRHEPNPSNEEGTCAWCGVKVPARGYPPFCTLACAYKFARQAHIDGVRYHPNDAGWIKRNFTIV